MVNSVEGGQHQALHTACDSGAPCIGLVGAFSRIPRIRRYNNIKNSGLDFDASMKFLDPCDY